MGPETVVSLEEGCREEEDTLANQTTAQARDSSGLAPGSGSGSGSGALDVNVGLDVGADDVGADDVGADDVGAEERAPTLRRTSKVRRTSVKIDQELVKTRPHPLMLHPRCCPRNAGIPPLCGGSKDTEYRSVRAQKITLTLTLTLN